MLKNQSRTDSRPYEAAGRYHNDFQAAAMFAMNEKRASAYLRATSRDVREKVDYIAALCMRAYTPLPGDRQLVGWLAFDRVEGSAEGIEKLRDADGFCYIGPDGRAVIGLSLEILQMKTDIYACCTGLHELAHLSVADHDDTFVERLSQLQFRFAQIEGERARSTR